MQQSYVYILKCFDNSYYTGITSNLEKRLFQHNTAFYPNCYTASRRPLELLSMLSLRTLILLLKKKNKLKNGPERKRRL